MSTVAGATVGDSPSASSDRKWRRMLDALFTRALAKLSAFGSAWDARLQRIKRLAETIARTKNSTHDNSEKKKTPQKGKNNG